MAETAPASELEKTDKIYTNEEKSSKIQDGNTVIKDFATYIKEYVPIPDFTHRTLASVSIFIPFVFLSIGAYLQIDSLNSIGTSYIRFFSPSQLLSDSLYFFSIITFKLIPFFLGIIQFFIFRLIGIPLIKKTKPLKLSKRYFLKALIITCLFTLAWIGLLWILYPSSNFDDSIALLAVGTLIPIAIYGVLTIRKNKNDLKEENDDLEDEKYSKKEIIFIVIFLIVASLLVISIISYFLTFFKTMYQSYKEAQTLNFGNNVNFRNLQNRYESQKLKYNLLYFNDQFIFIKINKDSSIIYNETIPINLTVDEKIEILKFEELFKKEDPPSTSSKNALSTTPE